MTWRTIPDLARDLGVDEAAVSRLVQEQKLAAVRFGDEWRISAASVASYARRHSSMRLSARARVLRWAAGFASVAILAFSAVALRAQSAGVESASAMPYHGYLELAGVPVEGKRHVAFTLYDGNGSPTTWSESHLVNVAGGHFSALLGTQTALDAVLRSGVAPLSIGLTVQDVAANGSPTGTPVALAGRQLLGSVAYAKRGAPGASFVADSDLTSLGGRVYDRSGTVTPIGAILPFGGASNPPAGWLLCDGAAVSSAQYPDLFAALGNAWGDGGDGTGPLFNLPDLRGRFLRGVDMGSGRDPDRAGRLAAAPGANAGDQVGSIQNHAFTTHQHSYVDYRFDYECCSGGPHIGGGDPASYDGHESSGNTNPVGDSTETRPVNAYVKFIIKY